MLKNKMLKQTNEIWKLPKVQQSMSCGFDANFFFSWRLQLAG